MTNGDKYSWSIAYLDTSNILSQVYSNTCILFAEQNYKTPFFLKWVYFLLVFQCVKFNVLELYKLQLYKVPFKPLCRLLFLCVLLCSTPSFPTLLNAVTFSLIYERKRSQYYCQVLPKAAGRKRFDAAYIAFESIEQLDIVTSKHKHHNQPLPASQNVVFCIL